MDDKFIDHEKAQQIINWAVGAGALLKMLEMRSASLEPEEENELLNEAVAMIVDNMPDFFADYSLNAGLSLYEDFEEQERMVDDFMREIDERFG